MTEPEKSSLRAVAIAATAAAVRGAPLPRFSDRVERPAGKLGVVVRLYKKGMLRGEARTMEVDVSLADMIARCARSAALQDRRFRPTTPDELPYLEIEVVILSDFRIIGNPAEIVLGRDGLLAVRGRDRGMVLPQTSSNGRWSTTAFLEMTCRKGGMSPDAWRDEATVIHAFSADAL